MNYMNPIKKIIGTRTDFPAFVPPTPTCKTPVTVRTALRDLECAAESKANATTEQGNRRMIADRPGYTIRAECHGNIQFHYLLPCRISMRETAHIQSFPTHSSFLADFVRRSGKLETLFRQCWAGTLRTR